MFSSNNKKKTKKNYSFHKKLKKAKNKRFICAFLKTYILNTLKINKLYIVKSEY